jgi:hypothetical protein
LDSSSAQQSMTSSCANVREDSVGQVWMIWVHLVKLSP